MENDVPAYADKNLLKWLKVPKGYHFSNEEWEKALIDSQDFGCDWLEHFMQKVGGNVVSEAVAEMAKELDRLHGASDDFGSVGMGSKD